MKYLRLIAGALLGVMPLAGCSDHNVSLPNAGVAPNQPASIGTSVEKVLYRFGGDRDGQNPESTLIDASGTLYGTTEHGGSKTCAALNSPPGCGTIFRIESSGSGYTVLHRWPKSAIDGSQPVAGVIDRNGTLYGTTSFGDGSSACQDNAGCGTVFKMAASGKGYSILHKFNGSDGFAIYAGVIDRSGSLIGATFLGGFGSCSCGIVYALSQTGQLTVLHNFTGVTGGYEPFNVPIEARGVLYGATMSGGDTKCANSSSGCGTVYRMSATGKAYRKLYAFMGGTDGASPTNVVDVNGVLYGTTTIGGGASCSSPLGIGCGTIFAIDTSGKGYRVLHRFTGGSDGADPTSLSVDANGTLYGATTYGGGSGCTSGYGCGTVFKLSASGEYTVLYRFKGGRDGANPMWHGPIAANGTLYGTTYYGGGSGCGGRGCGAIFAI